MKKQIVVLAIAVSLAVVFVPVSFAQLSNSETYTVSATVPNSQSIEITAYEVPVLVGGGSGTPKEVSGTDLSFDPLTFDEDNQIYIANHYFYIDVVTTQVNANVTVDYTEGTNPNAANGGNGLGYKASATFNKATSDNEEALAAHPKKILTDVSNELITYDEFAGGWLRIYVGINTGDDSTPANGEVFSNADASGLYDGQLLISATEI